MGRASTSEEPDTSSARGIAVSTRALALADSVGQQGSSSVLIANSEARAELDRLRARRARNFIMVTGDNAREPADVVLQGTLDGFLEGVDIAGESMRIIRQNLGIIAVPNAAGMVLAASGLIGPVVATALNNGSNVTAALHGLRPLLRQGAKQECPLVPG